ncbi:MAG: FkbM family methyltransferase [Candidatus Kapabacteria bacterium]|nr:FkbM family methyltransferase [Candidatus Kapabacteria bacterium]
MIKRFLSPEMRDFLHDTRSLFNRITGIDIHSYGLYHSIARRNMLFQLHQVNMVLDIGANRGQFGGQIRRAGYKQLLHSFEPLSSAFALLEKKAKKDALWIPHHYALGDYDGSSVIHVSNNSQSSSMLNMTPAHTSADSSSKFIADEHITVKRLDSVFNEFYSPDKKVFLKIDAQGLEDKILLGALESLPKIQFVQTELSFVTLYEGETLFMDFANNMDKLGYRIVFIEQGFSDKNTAFALQSDVIFTRKD